MSNILRCKKCGDIITSKHTHDMVWCKCGAIAIDGGDDYCKITGNPEDMEVFVPSKLIEEKEREIEKLKSENHALISENAYPEADIFELKQKLAIQSQDKISFAVEQLEKVKEFLVSGYAVDNEEIEKEIDNQIKQLKEMK